MESIYLRFSIALIMVLSVVTAHSSETVASSELVGGYVLQSDDSQEVCSVEVRCYAIGKNELRFALITITQDDLLASPQVDIQISLLFDAPRMMLMRDDSKVAAKIRKDNGTIGIAVGGRSYLKSAK